MAPSARLTSKHPRLPFLSAGLVLCAVVLAGLGGKSWLLQHHGFEAPFMDQWDAEAAETLLPQARGELTVRDLLRPHNEHRPVWTKLLVLGGTALNGQWDNRFNAALAALVHLSAMLTLLVLTTRGLRPHWRGLAAVPATALLALPLAWENTLVAFQSQFYFLLLFSIVGVWWLATARPAGLRSWLGLLACAAALFTVAGGALTPLAAGAGRLLGAWAQRRFGAADVVVLVVCAALAALGFALVTHVPGHDALRAADAAAWLGAFARQLAFPTAEVPWLAPLLVAPLAWWLIAALHAGRRDLPWAGLSALTLWVLAQMVALAWSRGGMFHGMSVRYFDLFAVTVTLNAVALALLWQHRRGPVAARLVLSLAWAVTVLFGLHGRTAEAIEHHLEARQTQRRDGEEHLRRYVLDGDRAALLTVPPAVVGYPHLARVADLLDQPELRRLLPPAIRAPVRFDVVAAYQFEPHADHLPPLWPGLPRWSTPPGDQPNGGRRFESAPLPEPLAPVLRFRVAGDVGRPALPLALRSLRTGERVVLRLDEVTGLRWKTVNLVRPPTPVVLTVEPQRYEAWGAFTAPIEVGLPAWYLGKVLKAWGWFFAAAAAAFAVGVLLGLWPERQKPLFSLKRDGSVEVRSPVTSA
jgi:hypothetical protein